MMGSAIALTASGFRVVGWVPALRESKRFPATCRRIPSAIWLRHEFPVQRNNIRFIEVVAEIIHAVRTG